MTERKAPDRVTGRLTVRVDDPELYRAVADALAEPPLERLARQYEALAGRPLSERDRRAMKDALAPDS